MKPETLRANAAALAEMSDPPSGIIDSLTEAAAEIERLKADIADLLPMCDADAKIISDQAAEIEWLKGERDNARRLVKRGEDYLLGMSAQLAQMREAFTEIENSYVPGSMAEPCRIARQALATYRAKGQADG